MVRKDHALPTHARSARRDQGYDPHYRTINPVRSRSSPTRSSIASATDKARDGYRTLPTASPWSIRSPRPRGQRDRQFDELMKRSLIDRSARSSQGPFSRVLKLDRMSLMMRGAAWIADYPDGDNFMQLLYGPNRAQSNERVLSVPEFDKRRK